MSTGRRRFTQGADDVAAAVITGPGKIAMTSRRLGDLDPNSVRVALEGCGVCGSHLPLWQGRPWFEYPLEPGAPGHEGWGRIEAVGDDVAEDAYRTGSLVAVLDDFAFSEAVDVPADACVPVPPELSLTPALVPGEALGCAVNAALRSGFREGEQVCVVGIGFLGALIVALAAAAGAHVIAVSRRPFSLQLARKMGTLDTVAFTSMAEAEAEVTRITGGALCDVVVEAVGAQEPLDLAGRLTRVRGRLVIAGFHQDGARTPDVQLWNWRGIDVVNAHERELAIRRRGVEQALELLASGVLDPTPLYTHCYPLSALDRAMDAMVERPDGFMKALVLT